MSKRSGIRGIRLLTPTLDWCKRVVVRHCRRVREAAWAAKDGRRNAGFGAARAADDGPLVEIDRSEQRIELKEFIKVLGVGDRIRVFCNDGVLVAEKISPTQFKLVYSEEISKFVH